MKKINDCDVTFYKRYKYYSDISEVDTKLIYRFVNDLNIYRNKVQFACKFKKYDLKKYYMEKFMFSDKVYKEFLQQIIDKYQLENFDENDWTVAEERLRIYFNEKS